MNASQLSSSAPHTWGSRGRVGAGAGGGGEECFCATTWCGVRDAACPLSTRGGEGRSVSAQQLPCVVPGASQQTNCFMRRGRASSSTAREGVPNLT